MQELESGMNMRLVLGLSAPIGQSRPHVEGGQIEYVLCTSLSTTSSFTVTNPLPSILATRFCSVVCFAHRNSPVAASKLQAMPVLQGTPVNVLRGPRRASGLTESIPAAVASGLTGVLMTIIS